MEKRSKRGFTLAELMTVVAILGILVALAMPIFLDALEHSRAETCSSHRRAAVNLLDLAELKQEGFIADSLTDKMDWEEVRGRLENIGLTPLDALCPSGGTVTLRFAGEEEFSFECSLHKTGAGGGVPAG